MTQTRHRVVLQVDGSLVVMRSRLDEIRCAALSADAHALRCPELTWRAQRRVRGGLCLRQPHALQAPFRAGRPRAVRNQERVLRHRRYT